MAHGIILRLTHLGLTPTSLLITDVYDGTDGPAGYKKPGAVYVPQGGTTDLVYTTTVSKSFEEGVIRGFIAGGEISAQFVFGPTFQATVLSSYGNFASNLLALAEIVARGDAVGGLPPLGATYYNTTIEGWRTWNGSLWVGRSPIPVQ